MGGGGEALEFSVAQIRGDEFSPARLDGTCVCVCVCVCVYKVYSYTIRIHGRIAGLWVHVNV